jgi:hypothetical protein
MSYIFPKRRLRDQDVLDPVEINDDVQPVVENYGGRINQHNLASSLNPAVQPNAYYKVHYAKQSYDAGFGTYTSPYLNPELDASGTCDILTNDGSWMTLTSIQLDVTTGNSVLWIVAQLQQLWAAWQNPTSSSTNPFGSGNPAKTQFALLVNGNLIETTLTGLPDPFDQCVVPEHPKYWRTLANVDNRPGPRLELKVDASGIGPEIVPVRLSAVVPVPAGSTTVRVVARRLGLSHEAYGGYDDDDWVGVGNRQLMALELPVVAATATAFDDLSVEAFQPEDDLSQQTLGTERIDRVRAKLNSVGAGALSRGACDHVHLASKVPVGASATQIITLTPGATSVLASYYPGFETATVASAPAGQVGWWPVWNSSNSKELKTGSITVDKACYLVVLADVQLHSLNHFVGGTAPTGQARNFYGAFSIIMKRTAASSPEIIEASEVYVNNWNNSNPTLVNRADVDREQTNVSLFAVIEFDSGANPIGNLDFVGVYNANIGPRTASLGPIAPGVSSVRSVVRRGSFSVLQIEKT